jgi:hypothetical protein
MSRYWLCAVAVFYWLCAVATVPVQLCAVNRRLLKPLQRSETPCDRVRGYVLRRRRASEVVSRTFKREVFTSLTFLTFQLFTTVRK